MDPLKDLIGGGQAGVTMSFELKDNSFGQGFGVFCSVHLTCEQSVDGVRAAATEAALLAVQHTENAFEMGKSLFETVVAPDGRRR